MKNECSIILDLLPLYVEDMVSEETAKYVSEHLATCPECQAELEKMREGTSVSTIESQPTPNADSAKPFKKVMKRMNRQLYSLSYSLVIFFIFLGFGWTSGEHLLYNSLIMPIVGVFGYIVFGWRSLYKIPILLLAIDMFVCVFELVPIDIYSAILWTLIYSLFVFVGVAIAFLLHFALRKEKTND